MLDLDYPNILQLFQEHLDPRRTESAAFLVWYLENYYRLDQLEAVDSVCDQRGDKGVDGIYVNDNDMTITVFQSRISQSSDTTIGDTALKEFYGTLSQFEDQESIQNLTNSGGEAAVVSLVKRLDLVNKIKTHELRGEFLCNIEIDGNGTAYLDATPQIIYVGKTTLTDTYISDERLTPVGTPASFDIIGFHTTQYTVDADTKAIIAPVKANELVALDGISDQSLFAFNVRGPLGRTQVNRDIIKSIKDPSSHKLFPLFHNGITVICEKLNSSPEKIDLENYFVVNGCQSLNSLYDNRSDITDDLRILTKFVQMDINSSLSEMVTRFSNNQNGVKARDFKANNPIQIRLQNDFDTNYSGEYAFEIKRGELPRPGINISNETAGLYLMAFDLKEPWATHRKYQVFDDKHADLFARPEVNADRIVFCQVIAEEVENAVGDISNTLFAKYALTKFAILYVVRMLLEKEELEQELLTQPEMFVRDAASRQRFRQCIRKVINDVIVDINAEVDEYGEEFDYRGKLRDSEWVKTLTIKVVSDFQKLVNRGRIESFSSEWKSAT